MVLVKLVRRIELILHFVHVLKVHLITAYQTVICVMINVKRAHRSPFVRNVLFIACKSLNVIVKMDIMIRMANVSYALITVINASPLQANAKLVDWIADKYQIAVAMKATMMSGLKIVLNVLKIAKHVTIINNAPYVLQDISKIHRPVTVS